MSSLMKGEKGFTLIEIMLVAVILALFAGMVSLSIGGSDARKNRGFYEQFIGTMGYVRLLSAERMQPIGIRLNKDDDGNVVPTLVALQDAYSHYQDATVAKNGGKNSMELSTNIQSNSAQDTRKPTWETIQKISLPIVPSNVSVTVTPLHVATQSQKQQQLQPWFSEQQVPQLLWYGTGQATPSKIDISYKGTLIGESIYLNADGSVKIDKIQPTTP